MSAQPESCDCLVFCGDDPWLSSGKAKPCEYAVRRAEDLKEAAKLNRVKEAGPELLEALQELLPTLEDQRIDAKARAAIAKATGVTA